MTIDTELAAAGGKAPLRLSCLATAVLVAVILGPIGTASAQDGLRFRADASAASVDRPSVTYR